MIISIVGMSLGLILALGAGLGLSRLNLLRGFRNLCGLKEFAAEISTGLQAAFQGPLVVAAGSTVAKHHRHGSTQKAASPLQTSARASITPFDPTFRGSRETSGGGGLAVKPPTRSVCQTNPPHDFLKTLLLHDVSPIDPVILGSVLSVLATVVLLACYVPARRAMRVDPMTALRYE